MPGRRRRTPRVAAAILALVVLACGHGWAQTPVDAWSVQTVALRDLRQARIAAAELRDLGLDAYTEFAMSQGKQYVRVRVGCFTDRDGADAMAASLRGSVTKEAASVPLTPGAPVRGCVERRVGFLKPGRWAPDGQDGAFRVEVAGHTAHVLYLGKRWAVLQDGEPTVAPATPTTVRAEQRRLGGRPVVALDDGVTSWAACPGTLLAAVGDAAIVDQSDAVVACRWSPGTVRAESEAP